MLERDFCGETQFTLAAVCTLLEFDFRPTVLEKLRQLTILSNAQKLTFFDTAQRHKGSDAFYLAEEIVGDNRVYVSFLLPHSVSSQHKHKEPVVETYIPLAGESFLNVDGKNTRLNPDVKSFAVSPEQVHQMRTEGGCALTLIVMENAASIPTNELHMPVGSPVSARDHFELL